MSFEHNIQCFDAEAGVGFPGVAGYTQLLLGNYKLNGEYDINGPQLDAKYGEFPRGTPPISSISGGEPFFYDSPSLPLPTNLTPVSEDMNYYTYLLFQPNGAGNIFVPLRLVTWQLHDSATHFPDGWHPAGSALSPPPQDSDCTDFPNWTQKYLPPPDIFP
jgi:hypothetical protein